MTNNYLSSDLSSLEIDLTIIKKLNKNNIFKVKDLWNLTRKQLKDLGLKDNEIKHITIKLQLNSIDLNKKIYNKN